MFIGREYELKQLNRYYQMNSFQFPVIYGRRRVGKTALLRIKMLYSLLLLKVTECKIWRILVNAFLITKR